MSDLVDSPILLNHSRRENRNPIRKNDLIFQLLTMYDNDSKGSKMSDFRIAIY